VSRSEKEFSHDVYSMAENLKNGTVISSKYQSESLMFKPPHVIVFSNRTWDRSRWTITRVVEFDLADPKWHVMPEAVVVEEEVEVEEPAAPAPSADLGDLDFDIDEWFQQNYSVEDVAAITAARFM
jgi:hypothetical protein